MYLGDVIAFEEFQCPLCKQFANILFPCLDELKTQIGYSLSGEDMHMPPTIYESAETDTISRI